MSRHGRSRSVRAGAATAALLLVAMAVAMAAGQQPVEAQEGFASECAPPPQPGESIEVVVGEVACQRIDSEMLGGLSPFSYYVAPGCAVEGARCPVFYGFSGTGGNYRSVLGGVGSGSGQVAVRALTSGPPIDPRMHPEAWQYADMSTWVDREPIHAIYVAPNNQTLPGGHGPRPLMDGLWSDWNPRYAAGGDQQQYDTPPPRFAGHVYEEVIPFVEEHLPAGAGREWRGAFGVSQGGFGALLMTTLASDVFATSLSISGGGFLPGHQALLPDSPLGSNLPVNLPHQSLPGVTPLVGHALAEQGIPDPVTEAVLAGFSLAWGDPVSDAARYHAFNPASLASNLRARGTDGRQAVGMHLTNNDTIPRRAEDLQHEQFPHCHYTCEVATLYGTMAMVQALDSVQVDYRFELNPGLHSAPYWHPFRRVWLEEQYAQVRQRDGGGDPAPVPSVFDYRTIDTEFTIWDWQFAVEREPVEFLNLRDVSCQGLTLQGTGSVTVTVPVPCRTGLDGQRTFTVSLGYDNPVDELAGFTQVPVYGSTVRIDLQPLTPAGGAPPCRPEGPPGQGWHRPCGL